MTERRRRGSREDDEPPLTEEQGSPSTPVEELVIISTATGNRVTVNVTPGDTVASLKERTTAVLGCQGQFLRLIASGKFLAPDGTSAPPYDVDTEV